MMSVRAVLDTDVVVAALRSDRGASRQILLAALERRLRVLLSVPLILEYEAVLGRPEQRRETGLTLAEIDALLNALAAVCEPIALRFLWRPQLRDPGDEMVLETAVYGRADYLVTFNARHFAEAASQFAIRVVRPVELWRMMKERRP